MTDFAPRWYTARPAAAVWSLIMKTLSKRNLPLVNCDPDVHREFSRHDE